MKPVCNDPGKQTADGMEKVRSRLVLIVVGFSTFLTAMGGSAINLALPNIGAELGISLDLASWVILAFLLSVTVCLLVAGRTGDLFGHKLIYLAGFSLFGIASLFCGLAQSLWFLVFARVVQGIGGAMTMATGPALLTTSFSGAERGKALGMLATATYTGLTIGPPLSGFLISALSWRWVFYINIPITAVILLFGIMCLPKQSKIEKAKFDWGGALTLIIGMPFLLLAISRGHAWGWSSWKIVGSALFGVGSLGAFIYTERRFVSPLLNLDLFRTYQFSGSVFSALCNYIALFVQIFLLPFYLIEALVIEPASAGLVLSAQPLVMALVASPSGWLSDRIGSRGLAVTGMMILAGGLVGISTIGPDTGHLVVAIWLGVMGLGTGIFISPNSSAIMGSAPRAQQGVAGGVMAVARNLGMMLGIALATLVFSMAGGMTGKAWVAVDYHALRVAFWFAAGVSIVGALASLAKGNQRPKEKIL